MAGRMDWEKAARDDRVRARGAEPADRQRASAGKCDHRWSAWAKAGAFDQRWRRTCAVCGSVQVRDKPTRGSPVAKPKKRSQPVARTKGDLVIRHADGSVKKVAAKDAAEAARGAMPKWRSR